MTDKNPLFLPLHRVNDIEEGTPICQYMDFDYLLLLLKNKSYRVNRKFTFPDQLENEFPKNRVFPIRVEGENIPPQPRPDVKACERVWNSYNEKRDVPAACWTLNVSNNILMWKNHTSKFGVCIKSSVHNFVASMQENKYDIWCGKMTYDGYYAEKGLILNMFSKNPEYCGEEECRFYFFEHNTSETIQPYITIPVDPSILIDEIALSPYINKQASKILAEYITSEYNINIHPSNTNITA